MMSGKWSDGNVATGDDWDLPADDLTASQRAAVEHFHGPLLVLAGPGSGKTRVITRRIARLIERGVRPWEILAITFTNKAAREMSNRVQMLLPGKRIWVSTFHRLCAKLLREHGRSVGLQPNFSIYDTGDQQQIIKQVMNDLNFDSAHFPAAKLQARISQAKNDLLTPGTFLARYGEGIGTHLDAVVAKVFPAYQKRLLEANAVDFDDLLVHVALLLAEQEDLRAELDQRYRFILVDEYQDTNAAQYQIVAALSQIEPNLCATGDPDQSIYGWRGARIENILRFEQDFPDVTLIRLEENFRSTPEILRVADDLIAHNIHRKAKKLKTDNSSGEAVEMRLFLDGQQEAVGIANEIAALVESGERSWKDFAVFYRVNALSRSFETAFARQRIPYQMVGGVAFYERMEVKDLLGYLRLIENSNDRVAFLRVVNTPVRGIGKSSIDKLIRWADGTGTPLLEAARCSQAVPDLPKKAAVQLRAFAALIDDLAKWNGASDTPPLEPSLIPDPSTQAKGRKTKVSEADSIDSSESDVQPEVSGVVESLLREVLRRISYTKQFEAMADEDDIQRCHNIDELISSARLFDEQQDDAGEPSTLGAFLETASLAQDVDSLNESTGAVTLMTLHSAKGLEFPCVYLVAVEQNLIPHERSLKEHDIRQLEEERRLLFVGITRAREKLVLTHTTRRELHGRSMSTIPSIFVEEISVEHRDHTGASDFDFASAASHDDDLGEDDSFEDDDSFDDGFDRDDAGDNQQSDTSFSPAAFERPKPKPTRAPARSVSKGFHLTTGAALEAGTSHQVEVPFGFHVGMTVRHPRYGLGTVTEIGGLAKHRTVTVEFSSDQRMETFVASKCPLQPVGLR